jgi:hypothetical protein
MGDLGRAKLELVVFKLGLELEMAGGNSEYLGHENVGELMEKDAGEKEKKN